MNFPSAFPVLFFAIVVFVVGSFLFKIFKHGGFKAAMFGAPIEGTVGEVKGGGVKLMNTTVRVHTLGGGNQEPSIGLEVVVKSSLSYQMMPVTLSVSEARKLIVLLQSATAGSDAT